MDNACTSTLYSTKAKALISFQRLVEVDGQWFLFLWVNRSHIKLGRVLSWSQTQSNKLESTTTTCFSTSIRGTATKSYAKFRSTQNTLPFNMGKVVYECSWTLDPSKKSVVDEYVVLRKLGKGGQGKTDVVQRRRDQKVLVRKVQKKYRMHGNIPEEMHILENILSPHPCLVEFDHSNYVEDNNSLVLYFESCEGGDLSDYIPDQDFVSEDFIWSVFIQLADALAFLHHGYDRKARDPYTPPRGWQPIIHRDVKPANVFLRYKVSKDYPKPNVVLGDFGLATLRQVTGDCGTDIWVGPELGSNRITAKSDVWGLGAIIHALAHGKGPVGPPPKAWRYGKYDWREAPEARKPVLMPLFYSGKLNGNMMDCLKKDPDNRISSDSLVRHLQEDKPRKTKSKKRAW